MPRPGLAAWPARSASAVTDAVDALVDLVSKVQGRQSGRRDAQLAGNSLELSRKVSPVVLHLLDAVGKARAPFESGAEIGQRRQDLADRADRRHRLRLAQPAPLACFHPGACPIVPQCVDFLDLQLSPLQVAPTGGHLRPNTLELRFAVYRRLRDRQQRLETCAWLEGKPSRRKRCRQPVERHLCVRIRLLQIAFCRAQGRFSPPRPSYAGRAMPPAAARSCHPAAPGTTCRGPRRSRPGPAEGRSLPRP